MRKFYFKAREDVLMDPQGGIMFDSDALESMLKDNFGDMKMCDVEHPRYCYRLYIQNYYIIA